MKRHLPAVVFLSLLGLPAGHSAGDAVPKAPVARPEHWAFRPVVRPQPPTVKGAARTAVDRFLLAALEARGLTLSPEADRLTLVRRVSFDLTGLPPTPAEADAFLADTRPDAYERMVERYLASRHYGERWGKHWLDTVGYADSKATSTPTATGLMPGATATTSSAPSTPTSPTTASSPNSSPATNWPATAPAAT